MSKYRRCTADTAEDLRLTVKLNGKRKFPSTEEISSWVKGILNQKRQNSSSALFGGSVVR